MNQVPTIPATVLGFGTSERPNVRRWSEITISRDGELYRVESVGRAASPDDPDGDLVATHTTNDPRDVVRFLSRPNAQGTAKLTNVARTAIEQAAAADSAFAAGLEDALEVEDYAGTIGAQPLAGSASFVLRRDRDRSMRFCGRLIGFARESLAPPYVPANDPRPGDGVPAEQTIAIYAVDDETFAVARAVTSSGAYVRTADVGLSPYDVLARLKTRDGWTRTARRALKAAAATDAAFAAGAAVDNLAPASAVVANSAGGDIYFDLDRKLADVEDETDYARVYHRRDGGYVVERIPKAGKRVGEVYETAEALVRAYDVWPDLLAKAAQRDQDIARALPPEIPVVAGNVVALPPTRLRARLDEAARRVELARDLEAQRETVTFADGLTYHVENYVSGAATTVPGATTIVLRRERMAAIRFAGRLLAAAVAMSPTDVRPADRRRVAIYRVNDGSYAVENVIGGVGNAVRRFAIVGLDAEAVLRSLMYRGGLPALASRALLEVAKKDVAFAALDIATIPRSPHALVDGKGGVIRFVGSVVTRFERENGDVLTVWRTSKNGFVVGELRADGGNSAEQYEDAIAFVQANLAQSPELVVAAAGRHEAIRTHAIAEAERIGLPPLELAPIEATSPRNPPNPRNPRNPKNPVGPTNPKGPTDPTNPKEPSKMETAAASVPAAV
jgi:hypothetical protein